MRERTALLSKRKKVVLCLVALCIMSSVLGWQIPQYLQEYRKRKEEHVFTTVFQDLVNDQFGDFYPSLTTDCKQLWLGDDGKLERVKTITNIERAIEDKVVKRITNDFGNPVEYTIADEWEEKMVLGLQYKTIYTGITLSQSLKSPFTHPYKGTLDIRIYCRDFGENKDGERTLAIIIAPVYQGRVFNFSKGRGSTLVHWIKLVDCEKQGSAADE